MPRLVKMSDLVTRCQQRADMENQTFVNDTSGSSEWLHYIHTVYAELHGEISKTGMRHFEMSQQFTTDGGAVYALPDDHLSTVGVDRIESDGSRFELYELMAQERNRYTGSTSNPYAFAWSVVGSGQKPLTLYPTPPSGKTYEVLYVPQPPDLTNAADSDVVDMVTPDGENFVIWGAAALALAKEESDPSFAVSERERLRVSIVEWATLRSLHEPRRIIALDDHEDEYGPWRHRRDYY
jgi:hypothetical protein